jgi:hypothetical protein
MYTRRNGKFFLQITAHPEFGLPFGQDRLIPIWVATLALRQRSRTVRFSTAAEMLDFFRLFKDGSDTTASWKASGGSSQQQSSLERATNQTKGYSSTEQDFTFFDRLHLWFHHDESATSAASTPENLIVLSETFYDGIDHHRIPVERE